MRRMLVALVVGFALLAWAAPSPVPATHTLPDDCATFPVATTYEAPQDRGAYLIANNLAGFNRIAPDDDFFGTPRIEQGPRAGRSVTINPYVPPTLLKAISWIESATAQADHSVFWGATGPAKVSFDCGHGIMQITSGMTGPADGAFPSGRQALIATHYLYNIGRGSAILVDKWNAAPQVRPIVGRGDPRIVEDWYFAVWSYNGFASTNNPLNYSNASPYSCSSNLNDGFSHNRGNFPYQELVYGCASRPPSVGGQRLWTPLALSLPNLGDPAVRGPLSNFPNSSAMDIPRPSPSHQDPTGRPGDNVTDFMLGSPSLTVSATSVIGRANQVTITNRGTGILSWRARPLQSWIKVDRKAGVSLGSGVPCTSGQPCARTPAITITIDTATAPSVGEGQVVIEGLNSGQTKTVSVATGKTDHFYTIDDADPTGAKAGGYAWEGLTSYISAAPRSGWVPLHRLWKAGSTTDHFYTTDEAQRVNAIQLHGYEYESIAGYISPNPGGGLVPLYRLWKSRPTGDHFYTADPAERNRAINLHGYTDEGVIGYVSAEPGRGLTPFYRWWNGDFKDHFYTIEPDEPTPRPGDPFRFEGVEGYVEPAPRSGWAAFQRLWKGPATFDHFYTTSQAQVNSALSQGYVREGVEGYLRTSSAAGLVPLYRLWKPMPTGDHFYTVDAAARATAVSQHGYVDEGIAGYVSRDGGPGLVPLFRWWSP